MSHSGSFFGATFHVQSATQLALSTVRIRFAQDPVAANPASVNDGLNPSLYTLTGPAVNSVTVVTVVPGDLQALDLTLLRPLAPGIWTVAVAGTLQETSELEFLQAPFDAQFTTAFTVGQDPISGGAVQDSAEKILRKHLNSTLVGRAWDALIAALSLSDDFNWENARLAFDQLFKSTASGLYLDRKAGNDGLSRPPDIGLSDELFRELSIKVTNNKLTVEAVLEVLEIFYGPDATRANVSTGIGGPWALTEGDTLDLLIDEKFPVHVVFDIQDFTAIGQAQPLEVAAAITRTCKLYNTTAYAIAVVDTSTGDTVVRIYSGSLGLSSSVRVTGGTSQRVFGFPQFIPAITDTTNLSTLDWDITTPFPNVTRFEAVLGSEADLLQVQIGDYVVVSGTSFAPENRGSLVIIDVSVVFVGPNKVQYFDVINEGFDQSVSQTSLRDVLFFRPSKSTIQSSTRTVVVAQAEPGLLEISIPATTQAVNRTSETASYLESNSPQLISSLVRDQDGVMTVTLAAPHGFDVDPDSEDVGRQVFIDNARAGLAAPPITGGSSGPPGIMASSQGSFWQYADDATDQMQSRSNYATARLEDGTVLISGGNTGGTTPDACLFTLTGNQYDYIDVGNMTYSAEGHTLVALANGNAASLGGTSAGIEVSSTSLYDYFTQSWTATPAMTIPRAGARAVRLIPTGVATDNYILITGGFTTGATPTATSEYNIATATAAYTVTGSMSVARTNHCMVPLLDGTAIVFGGVGLHTAEVFDVGGGFWSMTGGMAYSRKDAAGILLPDGRVLAIGGTGKIPSQAGVPVALSSAEIWSPATGMWLSAGKMSVARGICVATYLPGKNVVLVSSGESAFVDQLDVATMKWSTVPSPRGLAVPNVSMHTLDADRAIVFPYEQGAVIPKVMPELYAPGSDVWSGGGLNGIFRIIGVPSATSVVLDGVGAYALNISPTAIMTPMEALPHTLNPGPFIYNTVEGPSITGVNTTLDQVVEATLQYATLAVDDATPFPDEPGYLAIGYGYDEVSHPIRYLGLADANTLILDFSYRFVNSHQPGASVILLSNKGAFNAPVDPHLGLYATASSAGRVAAQATVESIVAAGVTVDVDVVYPGDKGLGKGDKVMVWGGDDVDAEVAAAREEGII